MGAPSRRLLDAVLQLVIGRDLAGGARRARQAARIGAVPRLCFAQICSAVINRWARTYTFLVDAEIGVRSRTVRINVRLALDRRAGDLATSIR